jgi:hypothetical protein
MGTVYEMKLEAVNLNTFSPSTIGDIGRCERIPVSFKIIEIRENKYEVWFEAGMNCIRCDIFTTYINALRYINKAMKTAMKSKFLYQKCTFCEQNIYYPLHNCNNCGRKSSSIFAKWELETQIEKNSKHLGLSMKNEL